MIDPVSAADGHTYERRVIQGGCGQPLEQPDDGRIDTEVPVCRSSTQITICPTCKMYLYLLPF